MKGARIVFHADNTAVGGCGQRINGPCVKANHCLRRWLQTERGDHVLEAAGDTLTVELTAAPHFLKNQTKGRQHGWKKRKDGGCQLFWKTWSRSLASERQEEENLDAGFCTKHSIWRCCRILFGGDGLSCRVFYIYTGTIKGGFCLSLLLSSFFPVHSLFHPNNH